ncbi:MAG: thiamine pyrophosphate-dependent enzyme, partial [Chloroflexi bacterium]|nr:thiamine pyrophosphate-dependent enzyme [Chloroflexota bacterium]
MLRREGIAALVRRLDNEPVIANLGPATFDLYAAGDRDANLYTWGAMGLASSVALGVALAAPDRKVFVTDGDGSLLMNLGSLATIARQAPPNLVHIVWDNRMWYETGGQPTHTSTGTDLAGIALAAGIRNVARAGTVEAFEEALDRAIREPGPWFIHVDIEETGEPRQRPTGVGEEKPGKLRPPLTGAS